MNVHARITRSEVQMNNKQKKSRRETKTNKGQIERKIRVKRRTDRPTDRPNEHQQLQQQQRQLQTQYKINIVKTTAQQASNKKGNGDALLPLLLFRLCHKRKIVHFCSATFSIEMKINVGRISSLSDVATAML